jgi:hypothetical protein
MVFRFVEGQQFHVDKHACCFRLMLIFKNKNELLRTCAHDIRRLVNAFRNIANAPNAFAKYAKRMLSPLLSQSLSRSLSQPLHYSKYLLGPLTTSNT